MDASNVTKEDNEIYELVKDKNLLTVVNKTDKSDEKYDIADLYVSALTKQNIDELRKAIMQKSVGEGIDLSGDFLCEERHFYALKDARDRLSDALLAVGNTPLDILAIDVKAGWDALGEISGKTATEEIINNIFSKFCVGK